MSTKPFLGLALALTLAACASPTTRYYTLSEHAGAGAGAGAAAAAPAGRIGVYLTDVTVPEAVDRQPLVLADAGNRVKIQEFDQWAGPLEAQITRVVVGDLRQILGVPTVASEADLVGDPKALRLKLVVEQFEGKVGSDVAVRARWSIARGEGRAPVVGTATVARAVVGARVDDVVDGWNGALWEISQDIAQSLAVANRP